MEQVPEVSVARCDLDEGNEGAFFQIICAEKIFGAFRDSGSRQRLYLSAGRVIGQRLQGGGILRQLIARYLLHEVLDRQDAVVASLGIAAGLVDGCDRVLLGPDDAQLSLAAVEAEHAGRGVQPQLPAVSGGGVVGAVHRAVLHLKAGGFSHPFRVDELFAEGLSAIGVEHSEAQVGFRGGAQTGLGGASVGEFLPDDLVVFYAHLVEQRLPEICDHISSGDFFHYGSDHGGPCGVVQEGGTGLVFYLGTQEVLQPGVVEPGHSLGAGGHAEQISHADLLHAGFDFDAESLYLIGKDVHQQILHG